MRATQQLCFLISALTLIACGPIGPIPGSQLQGSEAPETPKEWSFSDTHKTIQLEVRPSDPYSVNLWCIAMDGSLYIGAGDGESSFWAQRLLIDAKARVRIDTTLYRVGATRVTDVDEINAYIKALSTKYENSKAHVSDFLPDSGEVAPSFLFRLSQQP
jgi:hypothetical protein